MPLGRARCELGRVFCGCLRPRGSIGTICGWRLRPVFSPHLHGADRPCVCTAQDPNTGVAMFESSAIVEYLYKTYGPAAA